MDAEKLKLASEAWQSVVRGYQECSRTISHELKALDINMLQCEVLLFLLKLDTMTQSELSERCFSAKSGISVVVADFEKRGIIRRSRHPHDKRAVELTLTPKGRDLANRCLDVQQQVIAELAIPIASADLQTLKDLMSDTSERLRMYRQKRTA